MGKEAKIGLGVLVVLVIVFGILLGRRFITTEATSPTSEQIAQASAKEKSSSSPTLSGGPSKPTYVSPVVDSGKAPKSGSSSTDKPWSNDYSSRRNSTSTPPSDKSSSLLPDDSSKSKYQYSRYGSSDGSDSDAQATASDADKPYEPFSRSKSSSSSLQYGASDHTQETLSPPRPLPSSRGSQHDDRSADSSNLLRGQRDYNTLPVAGTNDAAQQYRQTAQQNQRNYQMQQQQLQAQQTSQYNFVQQQQQRPLPATNQRTEPTSSTYDVQPGDTYWSIAEKVYGTGGFFKALQEHNRRRHPRADKLQVGDEIMTPVASVLEQKYPDLCPKQRKTGTVASRGMSTVSSRMGGGRIYVVEEGDTLSDIARYELGKSARWAEIYDLNRDQLGEEFDYLRPGMELVLPSDGRQEVQQDSVTRQPRSTYQR